MHWQIKNKIIINYIIASLSNYNEYVEINTRSIMTTLVIGTLSQVKIAVKVCSLLLLTFFVFNLLKYSARG